MGFSEFTNKSVEESLALLNSSNQGLSKKEVVLSEKKYGLNEVRQRGTNILQIFLRQVKSPFAYLLLAAAAVAILIGQLVDSIAVLAFIFINVIIGFFQEYKAERSIALLQKFIPEKVKVLRVGKSIVIDKKFLLPGDIVAVESGDKVPADIRISDVQNFLVNESALTGESVPASKITQALAEPVSDESLSEAKNIIFAGTSVVSGKARGVVVATGKNTIFGGISTAVSEIKKESAYEKNIMYFCKLILRIVVVTISLIFIANLLVKGISSFFEFLLFCVALIVSILPEALPAVVTFALSNGSLKMAKEKVVVKRLSAIEDLGNIEILCADKTGTLTQNKLSLEKIVSSDKRKILLYAALSFKSELESALNPFDLALSKRISQEAFKKSKKLNVISDLPFDSFRMRSSVLAENGPEKVLVVKGALESILPVCSKFSGSFEKSEIKEDVEREGRDGKRVLAVAFKKVSGSATNRQIKAEDEKGLTFLGYFVFEDPLKSTAKEALDLAKKLGVQIKIITGDAKEVAEFVVKKMGIQVNAGVSISGKELEKLQKEEFDDACENSIVFSRISPNLKHKIIKSLQKKYEVGFMGEGINDAPALKTADVGIAVAEASDIAREASDVVLLQKDLRVVVNGIKDGRTIFANINKYIKCALASNFGNFYSIAVISLFIDFLPMLPVQILLGNILSDFPLISVATDSVDVEELKKPKMYQLHNVLPLIILLALVSTFFDFIFFAIFYRQAPAVIQALWFIESILTEIVLIFVIRTRGKFWKAARPSAWLLSLTIIDAVFIIALPFLKIGQTWFHFVALPLIPVLIVLLEVFAYFWVSEFVKLIFFRHWKFKN